jgi:hypothetical protein
VDELSEEPVVVYVAIQRRTRLTWRRFPASQRKYRESKAEANAAQNTLEKEVTTLRDSNRTLQLKLRDIEVANDDFERQARNTTSSLEDLESKYNVAIERGVLLEEEIKLGEQERENLRVDAQRLREELSDLKIEAEILQDKIKKQESRHLSAISTDMSILESPMFEHSSNSTASSPLITTPPDTKSPLTADNISDLQDPPSPPMSDVSAPLRRGAIAKTPAPAAQKKSRLPSADKSVTPKPRNFNLSISSTRAPGTRVATTGTAIRTPAAGGRQASTAKTPRATSQKLPASSSLAHVRSLTAQMQRLEARVHSARSRLPAPVNTPPRASPRSSIHVPSTVTIRSRKRTVGSATSSSAAGDDATPTNAQYGHGDSINSFRSSTSSSTASKHMPRLSTSGVSRLSFGPLPNRNPPGGGMESEGSISRPSSRASVSSYARPASRTDSHSTTSGIMPPPRPMSRTSLGGARTPLGRPRSSLGGSLHGHSASVSYSTAEVDEEGSSILDGTSKTPSRRGTYSRFETDGPGSSGIPGPSGIPLPRRQSGGGAALGSSIRRTSSAMGKLADLGETY